MINSEEEGKATVIYALCGAGINSCIRVLQRGLPVSEIGSSKIPAQTIRGIWSVKGTQLSPYHKYLVVSYDNATALLAMENSVIHPVSDVGFLTSIPSVYVANVGTDGIIQVHEGGFRYLRGMSQVAFEWKSTGRKTISRVSSNQYQVNTYISKKLVK